MGRAEASVNEGGTTDKESVPCFSKKEEQGNFYFVGNFSSINKKTPARMRRGAHNEDKKQL